MPQVVSAPTPPPTPQSPGERIRDAVQDLAAGAMAQARAEIRGQISEAQAERAVIQARMDATRSGIERVRLRNDLRDLDRKIEKLEEALGKIESKLTTTDGPPTFSSTTPPPLFPQAPVDAFNPAPMVIAVVAIMFIGFPIAITFARLLWKRTTNAPQPAVAMENTRRFDRLEQSVDAIAIEVERISENQRYLTKLLAEPRKQEIGTRD